MGNFSTLDILFIVIGIAVVVVTILMTLVLVNLIIFLRTLKKIAQDATSATKTISKNWMDLKSSIRTEGFSIKNIIKFLLGLKQTSRSKNTKSSK